MNYKHFGVMIDCSLNDVIKAAEVRRLIDFMAGMGYACLENFTQRCLYAPGRTVSVICVDVMQTTNYTR